jgi:uncharacterized protein YwgA
MDINKILLLLFNTYNEKIIGKTTVQKRMYFLSDFLSKDFGFYHYYYGPFSNQVNQAINYNCGLGFLIEEFNFFPSDQKRFDYTLTDDGKKFVDYLSSNGEKEISNSIKKFYDIMMKCGDNGDYNLLSWAAKLNYSLKNNPSLNLESSNLKDEIKKYGWNLNNKEIEKGKDFLNKYIEHKKS